MRVKCFSVRLKSLVRISDKAFRAEAFDGSEAIIPASQIYGRDNEIIKSDAYWISEFILQRKELQYSRKKEAFFDSTTKRMLPVYIIEKHKPQRIPPVQNNEIPSLKSE